MSHSVYLYGSNLNLNVKVEKYKIYVWLIYLLPDALKEMTDEQTGK